MCNPLLMMCDLLFLRRTEEIRESDIGTGAGFFEVVKIGDEFFTFVVDCKDPKACSIVLRGASKDILNEVGPSQPYCAASLLFIVPALHTPCAIPPACSARNLLCALRFSPAQPCCLFHHSCPPSALHPACPTACPAPCLPHCLACCITHATWLACLIVPACSAICLLAG